ncbi:hypothetical protein Aperf_G00000117512 [Anoplocephala perfoliata]
MGNCLRQFHRRTNSSENVRRSNGHVSSNRAPPWYLENDPILHPAPGLSVPFSQLTEEQQVTIATRMALIATLPTFNFDETEHEKLPECVICMCDYVQGEELRKLPMCPHIFHRACVDDWLARSLTCPSCLQEIPIPSSAPQETTVSDDPVSVGNLESVDGAGISPTIERRTQTSSHPSAIDLREEVEQIKTRSREQQMSHSSHEDDPQEQQPQQQGSSTSFHSPSDVD